MDNLTHSLVGWALAETGLKRRTRKGLAACVLAANMPDIDVFFGWAPWAPLAMHRGFTHGLVGGVLVMPLLLAALLWLLDRWQVSRGTAFKSGLPMHFGWLLALCYLGAITHPLLDLQNVYAVELFSPLTRRWFHTDGLFIISPWLLAMLAAGIGFSRARFKAGKTRAGAPALRALAGVVGFIAINIGISALAWNAPAKGAPFAKPDRVFAAPEPLFFWRREVIWHENETIARGSYDPLHSLLTLVDHEPAQADNMTDPVVQRAAHATPEIEEFLAWSQMPMAKVGRGECSAQVVFADARFSDPLVADGFTRTVDVPLRAAGCPAR